MSSAEAGALAWAAAARRRLDPVCRSLLSPSAASLGAALEDLGAAQEALEALRSACREGRAEEGGAVRATLEQMRRQARLIAALLEHAAGWHREWARLLGALSSGYTAQGEPASPTPGPSWSLEG